MNHKNWRISWLSASQEELYSMELVRTRMQSEGSRVWKIYVQSHKYNLRQLEGPIQNFTSVKMAVFWDVVLCSLVDIYWCFRGAYSLRHQGQWWQHEVPLKHRSVSTRLHGAVSQKTAIFILIAMRNWHLTRTSVCFPLKISQCKYVDIDDGVKMCHDRLSFTVTLLIKFHKN
jgi:hypothetical protein